MLQSIYLVMYTMGTEITRQNKIEWFKEVFKLSYEKDKCLSLRKLLAEFCLQCNSTRKTGREIIQSFEDLGFIKIDGDDIIPYSKKFH